MAFYTSNPRPAPLVDFFSLLTIVSHPDRVSMRIILKYNSNYKINRIHLYCSKYSRDNIIKAIIIAQYFNSFLYAAQTRQRPKLWALLEEN